MNPNPTNEKSKAWVWLSFGAKRNSRQRHRTIKCFNANNSAWSLHWLGPPFTLKKLVKLSKANLDVGRISCFIFLSASGCTCMRYHRDSLHDSLHWQRPYTQLKYCCRTFFPIRDKSQVWPRSYPRSMATLSQRLLTSTCCLSMPFHLITFSRDMRSAGLEWLGTRSSHTWHMLDSSTWKVFKRRLLHRLLFDQVFRRLPLTDSLSVKITTPSVADDGIPQRQEN